VLGQATMVIVVATILAVSFRRNAAARHGVWLCALAGVLLSPTLALVVSSTGLAVVTIPSHFLPTRPEPEAGGSIKPIIDTPEDDAEGPFQTVGQPRSPGLTVASSSGTVNHSRAGSGEHRHRFAQASAYSMAREWVSSLGSWRLTAGLVVWTWALGTLVLLGRLFHGHLVSRRLRRTARPIDQRSWNALLSRVADALGLPREQLPPIAALPALREPVTAGVLHPMVLAPEALLQTLTAQQLLDVLVHECAHVIRRDPLVGLLQRLAELLFWPHPLVHFMNRRLSQAREEVCDDHVLRAGDPIGYARTLLAVAESCRARQPSSSLVTCLITPHWTLEARVAGLLDPRRIPMTTIHRGVLTAVASVLLTTGLAIAGVRLGEPAGSPQEKRTAAAVPAKPRRRPEQTRIIGVVIDEAGRPVAGAVVRVIGWTETFATTSGPDGIFSVIVDEPALHHHLLHASAGEGARQGLVYFPDTIYQAETTVRVVLRPARSLTVRVSDRRGAAVPDAWVEVPVENTTGRSSPLFPLLLARTDTQGLAHLRVPADARVPNVVALKPGFGLDYYEAYRTVARMGKTEVLPLPETITLVLAGARTVKIRALDSAGQPVSGFELYPWQISVSGKIDSTHTSNSPVLRVKTDAQGIATFDFLPEQLRQAILSIASVEFIPESMPIIISPDDIGREPTVRLLRSVPVAGRVIGADGQPMAGILLQADGRPSRSGSFMTSGQNARTGADGTFRFRLRSEMSFMIATVDEQWAAPSKTGIVTHEGQPIEGIEFRLGPGTVIRGRATIGPEHRPAADQMVSVSEQGPLVNVPRAPGQPIGNNPRLELSRRTMTDSEGRYQLRVGPGEYLLSLPPVIRPSEPIKVGNELEIVRNFDIEKPPVLQLTGLVVQKAPGDQPVAGAIVEGQPYGTRTGRSVFHTIADAQGRFHTERYHDPMMVVARSPDDSLAGLVFIAADDKDARVPISAAASIHGRITYEDGKPFAEKNAGCRIVADPPNQAEVKEFPPTIFRRMMTDAEGRYTVAGIPVGTRCTLRSSLRVGEAWHLDSVDLAVTKPGPISAPDLVLKPQQPAKQAPGKAQ